MAVWSGCVRSPEAAALPVSRLLTAQGPRRSARCDWPGALGQWRGARLQ